jgi:hypothetical protein
MAQIGVLQVMTGLPVRARSSNPPTMLTILQKLIMLLLLETGYAARGGPAAATSSWS